jgi:putative thioredoxin
MTQTANVIDVTLENFQAAVLQTSMRVPVLVDFWADWCAPCKVLTPVLEKLAEEYKGAFVVAKVNGDSQPDLVAHFGVRSLPTVKLFHQGRIVDEFTGAKPEKQIRTMLDKYAVAESEKLRRHAKELVEQGDLANALDVLKAANQLEPDNLDVLVDLARISAQSGDWQTAQNICSSLPQDYRTKPEVKQLQARMTFAERAGQLPEVARLLERLQTDPNDAEALYQLSLRQVLMDDFEGAINGLLALMQKNRAYGDDLARKTLIEVFDLLGKEDPLAKAYRRRLYALLY